MNEDQEISAPAPVKSPDLTVDMSCREVALRSFDLYFRNFLWNEKGARLGQDPEFLHYLRVASKRLRVALAVFENYFPEYDFSRYKCELKTMAPIFGKARDTDVYLEFLNGSASKAMNLKELKVLNGYKNFFLRRKKFHQTAVLKKLDAEDYKQFLEEFTNFISHTPALENRNTGSPVSEILDRVPMATVEELLKCSRKLNLKSSDAKLHKFRIKCRKLRYEVEIFLNITGGFGEELDRILIELQHLLGSHHDAVTAGKNLNAYMRTHKEYSKSRALRKLRKLQKERAFKFRRSFFKIFSHVKKYNTCGCSNPPSDTVLKPLNHFLIRLVEAHRIRRGDDILP